MAKVRKSLIGAVLGNQGRTIEDSRSRHPSARICAVEGRQAGHAVTPIFQRVTKQRPRPETAVEAFAHDRWEKDLPHQQIRKRVPQRASAQKSACAASAAARGRGFYSSNRE
jgi:hypothetical protein